MENSFLKNKIIIKYCSDYYRIINENFSKYDIMSDKVIQIYQNYLFSIEDPNKNTMKKAVALNTAVVRYFDDMEFRKELTNHLKTFKVPKGAEDVVIRIVDTIIKTYNKYMEGFTRNLYIPRWI